jgi:pimeloyl-ACP methyl ester carboxylesterase
VIRECEARGETSIVLMGNSIGGFTVASVAAELANLAKRGEANVKCTGLVLLNSAGSTMQLISSDSEQPYAQLVDQLKSRIVMRYRA